jgi:hypothetical protein
MAKKVKELEINDKFYDLIRAIPGPDGFYKSNAEASYMIAGTLMVTAGITVPEVLDILTQLYWATAECYGG